MTIICTKAEWETLLPEGNTGEFAINIHTMLVKAPSPQYQRALPGDKMSFGLDLTKGLRKASA